MDTLLPHEKEKTGQPKRLRFLDWAIFGLTSAICALGAANLVGISYGFHRPLKPLVPAQCVWLALGAAGMVVFSALDYKVLLSYVYLLYGDVILLLLTVAAGGYTAMGARRWINVGLFTFQPSEFAKFALILLSGYRLGSSVSAGRSESMCIVNLFWFWFAPAALVALEPDLGTLAILFMIFVTVLFAAGVRIRSFVLLALCVAGAVPLGLQLLKPYQIERLESFLDPRAGGGDGIYQVMEAQVAIGSGGLYGKGLLNATRAFVTDFVFAPFVEQFGFVGALGLLALYAGLLACGLCVATRAKDEIGRLIAIGVSAWIFWQTAVNLAMACGLLPVIGIPLPFVSYGGSSLVLLMTAVGVLISVDSHR